MSDPAANSTIFDTLCSWLAAKLRLKAPLYGSRLPFAAPEVSNTVFVLACLLYVLAQASVSLPLLANDMAIAGDDGYTYIMKAAQLRDCPLQDCPALNDLRQQFLAPTDNYAAAEARNRNYTRLFVVGQPLHSALVVGISSLGFSLETSYDILYAAAKFLIPLAVIYWVYSLWGKTTASVALLLLSPLVFLGHGLTFGVASVMAIALGCLMWGLAISRNRFADFLLLPLSLLAVLLHNMSVLYVAITICLYVLLSSAPLQRKVILNTLLLVALCAAAVLAPSFIQRPILEFDNLTFYPGEWSYLAELSTSLGVYQRIIADTLHQLPPLFILLPGIWLGLATLAPRRQSSTLLMGIAILALLVFGFIYVTPWYGGFTFPRVWPLVAIFMLGLFSHGLVFIGLAAKQYIQNRKVPQVTSLTTQRLLGAAGIVLLLAMVVYAGSALRSYAAAHGRFLNQKDVDIAPHQAALLPWDASTTVLYMDELATYYFLSHGGYSSGAIYYPAIKNTPDAAKWLTAGTTPLYVVQQVPFFRQVPTTQDGALVLTPQTSIVFHSQATFSAWEIEIEVFSPNTVVRLQTEGHQTADLQLQPGTHWVQLPAQLASAPSLALSLHSGDAAIGGLRPQTGVSTQWAWDSGLSFDYAAEGIDYSFAFDSAVLAENSLGPLTVLDDRGYTALAVKR